MKNSYLILFLFLFLFNAPKGHCTKHTITVVTSGLSFAFSPDSVSASVGDSIDFALNQFHFPQEVSEATWDINDSASNGGFRLPNGGGILVVNTAKIYYYVCGVHFMDGMKGRLFVTNPNGIHSPEIKTPWLEVFPNPVSNYATIRTNLTAGKENEMKIYDITGKCVYHKNNISPAEYLDLTGFSRGVYFVAIKSETVFLERKLVVSK